MQEKPPQSKRFDVATLGETMLRLTPPHQQRLGQSQTFDIHIGGSESNTAVGLARLGLSVRWISRLTNNLLGRMVAESIRAHGVDVSAVAWTDHDRVGLYFFEVGSAPRSGQVIYDRANSAFCCMTPDDLPPQFDAEILHLTGISLALSESARSTATAGVERARSEGAQVSFDTNFRAKLWPPDIARDTCHDIMKQADIIFIPVKDADAFYGQKDPRDHLHMLGKHYANTTIVMTLGAEGVMALAPSGDTLRQAAIPADPVGRLGGGDAFAAGFLFGYLRHNLLDALRWGAAAASLKYSILGELPRFTHEEVAELVYANDTPKRDVQR